MSLARCCMPSMNSTPPVARQHHQFQHSRLGRANDQPDFHPANDHKPVTIEGTAIGGVPQIQILGGSAGDASGLTFGSGSSGSSVQDLVVAGFSSPGIDITSSSMGDSVLGCWLGINASGSADANGDGIYVNASGATIGGTTTGASNVISGNTDYGVGLKGRPAWSRATKSARTRRAPPPWRTASTAFLSPPRAQRSAGPRLLPANIISGNTDYGVYILCIA